MVRYVKDCEPIERLQELVPCVNTKEKSKCNYLVKVLQDSGLNPKMCLSQTFDGAGLQKSYSSVYLKNRKRKSCTFSLCVSRAEFVFVQNV